MLLVDAGNLLHETPRWDDAKKQRELDRGEMFVDVFNMLGWEAQGIGEKDLAGGVDRLKALAKRAKYPFLSANLVDAKTGKPVFTPRTIVTKSGVKIGLFSVMSKSFPDTDRALEASGVRLEDPIATGKAQVDALFAEGAQVVVALAMLRQDEAEQLAKAAPRLVAILGASESMMLRYPRVVGSTYLTDAFQKGKYVSVLSLLVRKGDTSFVFEDPNRKTAAERKVAELDARIKARETAIEDAKGDAARARNLQWLEQNLARLREEKKQADEALASVGAVDGTKSFIAYDYPEVAKTLEDDPKVLAVVDKLKEKYPELKEPRH